MKIENIKDYLLLFGIAFIGYKILTFNRFAIKNALNFERKEIRKELAQFKNRKIFENERGQKVLMLFLNNPFFKDNSQLIVNYNNERNVLADLFNLNMFSYLIPATHLKNEREIKKYYIHFNTMIEVITNSTINEILQDFKESLNEYKADKLSNNSVRNSIINFVKDVNSLYILDTILRKKYSYHKKEIL